MGVKVEIGTMSVQSTSAKSVLDEQVKTCQLLIERFNQFCEDDSLKGKGYTSAKQYSQSVYLPLLNGMRIYLETLSQAIFSLHPKYTSEVGNESLDQDILEKQISSYEIIKQVQEAVLSLPGASKIMSSQTRQSISDSINNLSDQISVIQEKLDKLLAFDSSSSSLFNQLSDLNQAIKEGMASIQLNKQFQGGVFLLPTNMSWKKKLVIGDKIKLQRDIYKNMPKGDFGGDQSSPLSSYKYGSRDEKKRLEDIIKKYHPEIETEKDVIDYLTKLEDEGCGYVALINTLYSRYKGTEQEFENKFGFPMFIEKNGKKIPNYNSAIVDLYASQDNHNNVFFFFDTYNTQEDESSIRGSGTTDQSREYRYERYLKDKGISVDVFQSEGVYPINSTVENYEKYKDQGEVLVRESEGTVFYNMDGTEFTKLNGGHVVTITGVTDDGWFIVSSWGHEYKLNPAQIVDGSLQVVKYYE
ncbi:hypothetical protein FKX92_03810 [Streptococcus sanguinis]|uniref:LXG domain-containing protein n=1 Tax=Streptococcus sanguinis TaxID=1305 RepID=A0A5A7ZV30_STRSA|nr:T7SS effector LXG polymorphic toxin [Streptococcus sanguinis]KAA0119671.1 hypothetical protein FKX92_03810 [Streptococcus sanguinis]